MTDVTREDVEALVINIGKWLPYEWESTAKRDLAHLRSLLLRAEEERDRLQHIIDCADTPLMRDVMRERDACAELLRWQPHTERGLSNLHPQHRAAVERARALIAEEIKEAGEAG